LTCGETDTTSVGVMLLRAIFEVFEERKVERILTAHLLDALIERETEPWAEWWGPGGNRWERIGPAAKLAGLLRPFGITPKTLRAGEDRGKGYERAQFEDAFDRYLPRREKT
jgi:hypothetical protein